MSYSQLNIGSLLITKDYILLRAVLKYKKDPYVHCDGSSNNADIDSNSCEASVHVRSP